MHLLVLHFYISSFAGGLIGAIHKWRLLGLICYEQEQTFWKTNYKSQNFLWLYSSVGCLLLQY